MSGFLKQIMIICWKNIVLFRRNKFSFVCELLFSSLFTFIFVILVYYSSPTFTSKTPVAMENVLKKDRDNTWAMSSTDKDFLGSFYIYYYPNNTFVENVMKSASDLLYQYQTAMTIVPSAEKDATQLKNYQKNTMFAQVSFPADYSSIESLPKQIEYSIYTKE
jgi:hypothetical protein